MNRLSMPSSSARRRTGTRHRRWALAAGKHVLVEKPLAAISSDAEDMGRAAVAHPGLVCMTVHSLRFDPRYTILRGAAASGRLGDIVHITARRTPPLAALERVRGRAELPFWSECMTST
jgi:predicted dehydrogenase